MHDHIHIYRDAIPRSAPPSGVIGRGVPSSNAAYGSAPSAPDDAVEFGVRWVPGLSFAEAGDVPVGPRNLAWRAARLWIGRAGVKAPVRIELVKAVPPGAGLGGGSADAAAVLVGLQALWRGEGRALDAAALYRLAGRLGADVPFCIEGGAATVSGIGERMAPAPAQERWIVLLKPPFGISTRWAYEAWDRAQEREPYPAAGKHGAGKHDAGATSGPASRTPLNALEGVVFQQYPEMVTLRALLSDAGASGIRMSGSGSTLVGFAGDEAGARAIAERAAHRLDGDVEAVDDRMVRGTPTETSGTTWASGTPRPEGAARVDGPVEVPGGTLYRTPGGTVWVTRLAAPGGERIQLGSFPPAP